MAIDIKKFLDSIAKEEEVVKKPEDNSVSLDLGFEKGITEKLKSLDSSLDSHSLKELEKMYVEIKKFDENLPSKFLSIEQQTGTSFSNLTEKYSLKVMNAIESKGKKVESAIKSELVLFDENLSKKNYAYVASSLTKLKHFLDFFPKELEVKFLELSKIITSKDLQIQNLILDYHKKEFPEVKRNLLQKISTIQKILLPTHRKKVEMAINDLQFYYDSIPIIFKPLFVHEQIILSKAFISFKTFLIEDNKRDFDFKEKEFHNLLERFQHYQLTKNLNDAVLTYNELVVLFNAFTLSNLTKKKEFLEKITKTHFQLQELYVKNNVEMFLNSYSSSKILEEAREYLGHVAFTKKAHISNVELILQKLENLPKSLQQTEECVSFLRSFSSLQQKLTSKKNFGKAFETPKTQDLKQSEKSTSATPSLAEEAQKRSVETKKHLKNSDLKQPNSPKKPKPVRPSLEEEVQRRSVETKKHLEKKKVIVKELSNPSESNSLLSKKISVDSSVAKEIEDLYKDLKSKTTKVEGKVLFKKIFFYLDFLHLPTTKKAAIEVKIKKAYAELK